MVDYADIGKRIRACRLAKGMTQEQLANEVGVVVTHISHVEHRLCFFDLDTQQLVRRTVQRVDDVDQRFQAGHGVAVYRDQKSKAGVRQLDDRTACRLLCR